MMIPEPNLEPEPEASRESLRDIIPPTERNQDPTRTEAMHGLTGDIARPLTDDEKKAADRDAPAGERVYAPASERVPVEPVPGHREFIEHTDTHTREREAESERAADSGTTAAFDPRTSRSFGTYDDSAWNNEPKPGGLPFGLAACIGAAVAAALGGWLFVRWQRERNKPINRLRRQAKHAAEQIRDRVPSTPEEAVKPAAGLTTALLSILLILWQQSQTRSRQADSALTRQGKNATDSISELDWQKRLSKLKQRWNPSRLELEKISISRH